MSELLEKIHSKGYWRVNIRPTAFEKERIGSLSKCREIVETCQVQLRGWYYPHIDKNGPTNGLDWIESTTDSMGNIECWRFYQSAQFVHHLAVQEDYELQAPPNYLSILNSLYLVTEVFEFAARLASKEVLSPAATISMGLFGAMERQLVSLDPARLLRGEHTSQIPEMTFTKTYEERQLLGHSTEFALDLVCWIFERFNWINIPREVFMEDQRKLLERRL